MKLTGFKKMSYMGIHLGPIDVEDWKGQELNYKDLLENVHRSSHKTHIHHNRASWVLTL